MIANYHTHTYRCGHAEGDAGDYAAEAVKKGLQILGMADHTPWFFSDEELRSHPVRMPPEDLPGYVGAVLSAAEAYRGRLEILLGVESEYYPKYFARNVEMLKAAGIQYLLLGQHFLGNEVGDRYCGIPCDDAGELARYVSQSIEGMETGLFTYFAHPDLFRFTGDDAVYEKEMRRLCRAARDAELPLEINLLGIFESRHYPDERFWRIAAEEGNPVVLGCDAHQPRRVTDPESEAKALAMAERLGLEVLTRVPIRRL